MDDSDTQPTKLAKSNNDVDRDEFYRRLYDVFHNKKAQNTVLLSRDKYNWLIEKIKHAKTATKKTPSDYRRLKKFEIVETPDGDKLYTRGLGDNRGQMYVTIDEMYDIIAKYHVKLNHGGRSRMMAEIKRKYRNVTAESVLVYLSMCVSCKNKLIKRRAKPSPSGSKICEPMDESYDNSCDPIAESSTSKLELEAEDLIRDLRSTTFRSPELYSRGQVDILGVANEPGEEYKYLMVYRNFISKYIHLKPMKTLSMEEAVEELLEIFLVFGAPNILQSKNGLALAKPMCRRISTLCPQIKTVASGSIFSKTDFLGKSNEDILKKLNDWLCKSQNTKWQEGVKFVQYELNTTFHEVLCRTPSEMVFGENPKGGLVNIMAKNVYEELVTEEDLIAVLDNKDPIGPRQLKLEESLMLPSNFIKLEAEMEDENEMEEDETNI
uniref:Integrase catalytic domain-containing protein n=1 Tax=Heliothis virescens TaxID=7102 RepID=A0A2A4IY27_HELVI